MFEHLREHPAILVTGPHRSGTTICTKMVAHDTGHDVVLEEEFGYHREEPFECFLDADYGPKVIQCPFMAARIHFYPYAFVIWMNRPDEEIERSVACMRSKKGKGMAFNTWWAKEWRVYHTNEENLFKVKRENWELQKERIPNHLEIDYHSLADHPLWVPKENRNWHYRATEHGME